MTFKRIDDSTIRCIVTEEDLEENGLELDDFFTQSDKAQDFLRDIVEQAAREVGYETHQGMVSLQLMPLPNHALAITFSEVESDGLHTMVESIRDLIQDVKEKVKKKGVLQDGDALHREEMTTNVANAPVENVEKKAPVKKASAEKAHAQQAQMRMFAFVNLRYVIQFARICTDKNPIESTLYLDKEQKLYYLLLEKGRLSVKRFNVLCTNATEFSTYIQNGEQMLPYLEEHGEKLIAHRAVKVLAKL